MSSENPFILLDTCVVSNIIDEKTELTENSRAVISILLNIDSCPCISDLTFIELIEGCRNYTEFISITKKLALYDIMIYGHSEKINNYIKKVRDFGISSDVFSEFKKLLVIEKNKQLEYYFHNISKKYCVLFYSVMMANNGNYWFRILETYLNMTKDNILENIHISIYYDLISSKHKIDDYLMITALCIGDFILHQIDEEYNSGDIFDFIDNYKIHKRLSKYTKQFIFKSKKYKSLYLNNNKDMCIPLIDFLNQKPFDYQLEVQLLNDYMNFLVINSGFNKGKFELNDLVDIYNCSLICGKYCLKYYTNDKRWLEIINLEKEYNNKIALLNSKIDKVIKSNILQKIHFLR
ncbi:MAG: hypothetical protein SO253_01045 [Bacilli bacterium]|nr:hypothetical protein [Bacilli bacterium]